MKRFTAEEKGKGVGTKDLEQPRIRIRASDFDPYGLIKDSLLTLVGRLTNPREQNMSLILPFLPKKRNMVGRTTDSDHVNNTFKFRFTNEEDLKAVLQNRPYHYGRIPLHYLHEKVVCNIGLEIGELEKYKVTNSSARIRVTLNGVKSLIMGLVQEFDSGEESDITLEYENLFNHFSQCFRLSQMQSQCPERQNDTSNARHLQSQCPERQHDTSNAQRRKYHLGDTNAYNPKDRLQLVYGEKVDRHGNHFGNTESSYSIRAQGPRNKLAPEINKTHSPLRQAIIRQLPQVSDNYTSTAYCHIRKHLPISKIGNTSGAQHPNMQWQSKDTHKGEQNATQGSPTTP
ncbi:hypothetical protein N665_0056s0038 [Sinapis alba]|nr:hypothetical protein N665_0056s0038 [Sinapis alba]